MPSFGGRGLPEHRLRCKTAENTKSVSFRNAGFNVWATYVDLETRVRCLPSLFHLHQGSEQPRRQVPRHVDAEANPNSAIEISQIYIGRAD